MGSTIENARALQEHIKSGKIIEAMNAFYAPDIAMQENGNPPTVGLEKNIEREKQFLAQVKEWKGYTIKSLAADGDRVLVENVIEFINQENKPVRMEQVSVQTWKNGKVAHERFYYDSGAK